MFSSGIITFRETLEATLVVGILLSYLTKTNQNFLKKYVWHGVFIGTFGSILLAVVLNLFFGGLSGKTEEVFEGLLMFVTAGFLTWMILWVHRQKEMVKRLKAKIISHAEKGFKTGIVILTATAVLREGTETVLYLKATSMVGGGNQFFGAAFGLIIALVLGYALFRFSTRFRIATIFNVTGIFLLLFAAGLVSHGVHEFQEAGILPVFAFDPVFNISGILNHKETVGSFLRTLFGYTSKPTILELVSYAFYILFILWFEKFTDRLITSDSPSGNPRGITSFRAKRGI